MPCPGPLPSSDLFTHVSDLCLFSYPSLLYDIMCFFNLSTIAIHQFQDMHAHISYMHTFTLNIRLSYSKESRTELKPSVQLGHIKASTKGTAKYPLRRIDCKVFSIPQGTMSHTHENVYIGVLPNRVVLCFINNDAYNGSYNKNPFNAKHNDTNVLALYVDGRQVPSKPLQPNFAEVPYVRSYLDLFVSTGKTIRKRGKCRDGSSVVGIAYKGRWIGNHLLR